MAAKVRLQPAGREFAVEPDETIIDAAIRQGVALPYGCRSGSCGSCACRLISGEIDYPEGPPLGLMDDEIANGHILPCRAHPRSDLVIRSEEHTSERQSRENLVCCLLLEKKKISYD